MVKQAYRIVLLLALILSAMVYGFEFPTADFYLQTDGWFYFVHKSFNHYLLWHLDPFSSLLGVANRFVIGSIVSFFGLFLLLYSLRPERLLEAILLSFVFQYSVLHLWGFDTLMVQSTFLLPWLCLALRVCKSEQRKGLLLGSLAALVFAIALCFSALYLAILLVPISFLLVWSLQNWRPGFQELQVRSAPALILFGLLIVVVTAGHSLFPVPHFPSYPSTGHVLTTGSVAGNILPLAAPTAPIPYIDHVSMAALMAPLALILCLACLALAFTNTRKPPLVLLGALALLALDVFPPEGIRQIMPLATLGRLVPFLFYLPMTSIWLWVCLFYFLLVSFRAREWTLIAIVYATVMLLPPAEGGLLQHGVFLKSNQNAPLEEFAGRSEKDFNTHQSDFYLTRLLSPSYALLRDMGLWPLDSYLAIKHGKFRTIRKFPHVFSASHNSSHESFVRLADRQLNTRWSPEGGKQNGDEWLHLYLRTPLWLYGIELSTGAFFTDFARGLRLSYLENCTGADAASNGQRNSFEHILTTAEWDGALAYTVDDYPYLQSPSYVKVYFPRPVLAQCLLIEQIGQSKHYDWSIARVRLIRADEID